MKARTFEELLAEGEAAPVDGWDFSWFAGRATEERPPWGYATLIGERMAASTAALDIQTGGGEVLGGIPKPPRRLVATESWRPNVALATKNLAPLGAEVVEAPADASALPFPDASFDLVVERHPVTTQWPEVARVLQPGGTYLSQQIGAGSNHGLSEAMLGPFEPSQVRSPQRHAAAARAAGLLVTDLRDRWLRVEFFDVAAVVVFLRKVIWTVPGFTVAGYRPQLAALHERIERDGSFVTHSRRFLVEAHKPATS